jgi:hypothetical protein
VVAVFGHDGVEGFLPGWQILWTVSTARLEDDELLTPIESRIDRETGRGIYSFGEVLKYYFRIAA